MIPLHIDQRQMIGVYLRDNQGYIRFHPVGTRIAADGKPAICACSLHILGNFSREGREDQVHLFQTGHVRGADTDIPDVVRERYIKTPLDDITVLLPCTPFGSSKCRQVEPWMLSQELNKPLPDCSCSTKHSDIDHK